VGASPANLIAESPLNSLTCLETPRLRLRLFAESDLDELARWYADPEVMRYIGDGRTLNRDETWRQLATFLGHQYLRGFTTLAVEDRHSGALVGECGPWFPVGWPVLEVGWLVDPRRQGQGIATEAAGAVLAWCWANLDIAELGSIIHPDNLASARVATRLGATLARRLPDFYGGPADLWVHRRPEASEVRPST
jgi:RimJ/RimL family protein N-acetyltransferase